MATRGEAFAGLGVAIATPFRNGRIDYDLLAEQIEFQAQAGTRFLCPAGTTGESPTLSHEEHDELIARTIALAKGRMTVMPGTGSNSTAEALRLSRHAAEHGADALLVVGPYYNRPNQDGMYEHFAALARAVKIPICIYNIPGRTGQRIEPETIIRLAKEFSNIALVKEATGSIDMASALTAATDLTILSGDDSLTLPYMSVGGRGVISVVGNIVPKDMIALINAFDAGDIAAAQAWHKKLFALCRDLLSLTTNPIPIKAAMKLLGRDTGELRLPMTPLAADAEKKLRATLTAYGLM